MCVLSAKCNTLHRLFLSTFTDIIFFWVHSLLTLCDYLKLVWKRCWPLAQSLDFLYTPFPTFLIFHGSCIQASMVLLKSVDSSRGYEVYIDISTSLTWGKIAPKTCSRDNSNNYKQYEVSYEVALTSMVHIIFSVWMEIVTKALSSPSMF